MIASQPDKWQTFLAQHPGAHLLQSGAWGELKSAFGWSVERIIVKDVGAQLLFRRLAPGITFAYLAKGLVGSGWEAILPEIDAVCRKRHAIFLLVEPDTWIEPGKETLPPQGFKLGAHSIQPPRTLLVDIRGDEEAILSRMKQKTRYNLRLAQKKGVVVRAGTNIDQFHQLMLVTGGRDQFGVHSLDYYQRAYALFHASSSCELLFAEYNQQPLAALMVFSHGPRAWYLYGASSNEHRELMPTYLLQWEAMRWACQRGCTQYDLWGVPDADENTLEAEFANRSDGLWGVYRNKRGFGGTLARAAGPWDRVYSPLGYRFYSWWISRRASGIG